MVAKDMQHNQYRELGKWLQVGACGLERHREIERLLREEWKAMNIGEEWTELFWQGPAISLQTGRKVHTNGDKSGDGVGTAGRGVGRGGRRAGGDSIGRSGGEDCEESGREDG